MAAYYEFRSMWKVAAPLETVSETLLDNEHWTDWWPGLESASVRRHDHDIVGTVIDCVWRSQAGYRLKLRITITAYLPQQRFEFQSTGDLIGSGSWSFQTAGTDTIMHIIWQVHTTKWWMNAFSFLLRPIFVSNHDKLMHQGECGLRKYVTKTRPVQ